MLLLGEVQCPARCEAIQPALETATLARAPGTATAAACLCGTPRPQLTPSLRLSQLSSLPDRLELDDPADRLV